MQYLRALRGGVPASLSCPRRAALGSAASTSNGPWSELGLERSSSSSSSSFGQSRRCSSSRIVFSPSSTERGTAGVASREARRGDRALAARPRASATLRSDVRRGSSHTHDRRTSWEWKILLPALRRSVPLPPLRCSIRRSGPSSITRVEGRPPSSLSKSSLNRGLTPAVEDRSERREGSKSRHATGPPNPSAYYVLVVVREVGRHDRRMKGG